MAQYMFLFRGPKDTRTPDVQAAHMQRWMVWIKEMVDKGQLANAGQPLEPEGRVVRHDKSVTDGPFAEKDIVAGVLFVEAKSVDEAAEIAKGCPMLEDPEGIVEVRPVLKF
ncbi:MAG TPA: YciI family protein [Polyangiaceae bacterium]